MRTVHHGAVWCAAAALIATASLSCIEQVVDLTVPSGSSSAVDERCGWRERINPETGACAPCKYRTPDPAEVCPCGHDYGGGELPYCENDDAYYECRPCVGGPEACAALELDSAFGLGTTRDCSLVIACCDELAAAGAGTEPCCAVDLRLRCALDSGSVEIGPPVVSCESEPCCRGMPCLGGDTDCAPWQTCDNGRCTPACQPVLEECRSDLACNCQEVLATP